MVGSLISAPLRGQGAASGGERGGAEIPSISTQTDLSQLAGKPVIELVQRERGAQIDKPLRLQLVRLGQSFTAGLARRAAAELLESGGYADVSVTAELLSGGVRVRLLTVQRRIIARISVDGGSLDREQTLEAAGLAEGQEITRREIRDISARIREFYRERGFPAAVVSTGWVETEQPLRVVASIAINPGAPRVVRQRTFKLAGPFDERIRRVLLDYQVNAGHRADVLRLNEADAALTRELRQHGWHRARVKHRVVAVAASAPATQAGALLEIHVAPGPHVTVRLEGQRTFDSTELMGALAIDETNERGPEAFKARIRKFYIERGFLDVQVRVEERGDEEAIDLVLVVRENRPVRVVRRFYPCLLGSRSQAELDAELDGFLREALPGGDTVFGPAEPELMDIGSAMPRALGHRAQPFQLAPWQTYSKQTYETALGSLRDLYRAEGYLSVVVGPEVIIRRQCAPTSRPGRCEPVGTRNLPPSICPSTDAPIPAEDESPDSTVTCIPDPEAGVYCEPDIALSIPVKLGPQTLLWDVRFEGNEVLVEDRLEATAELQLGQPVSQFKLQQARRRMLELYADAGFAFATADVDLELSQDGTRGRAKFIISEREPVTIRGFVIRGAKHTRDGVILSRLELRQGDLYRRNLVRASEEQLATLDVFASVAISMEDPEVPAREKVVVIDVQERVPQYVDVRPGFSTGEGMRVAFEYGHRNVLGRAVRLRLRVQLGYLPGALIFDDGVRNKFEDLTLDDRVERRNSITLELPIAARYRLAIDGIDVRDNSRDFGITKRAAIVTLSHRLSRAWSFVVGPSFELNDARIFETGSLEAFLEENPQLVRLLNFPEGRSFAIALRAGATWDRRDDKLGPTRGTLVSAEFEPVVAYLDDDSAAVNISRCQEQSSGPTCEFKSQFLKVTNRFAGYLPLADNGLTLALSLRWGANFQLIENSGTYPDRLFFFGGSDSLRGHLQASVIQEDIAKRLVREVSSAGGGDGLTAREVVIRGGDFMLNPRAELRIPLTKVIHTALFLDTGNVWRSIDNVNPTALRYSAGTGLRAVTPIGPLAFDFGFKLDRKFYESSLGAFHFSVGVF